MSGPVLSAWAELQERILTTDDVILVSAMVRFEATLAVARDLSTSPSLLGFSESALISEAAALVAGYLREIDARDVVSTETSGPRPSMPPQIMEKLSATRRLSTWATASPMPAPGR